MQACRGTGHDDGTTETPTEVAKAAVVAHSREHPIEADVFEFYASPLGKIM